jgi:hypothetical protein
VEEAANILLSSQIIHYKFCAGGKKIRMIFTSYFLTSISGGRTY